MSLPASRLRPTGLTVLYDAHCPICRQARRWVERHRHLVPVRFVPAGSQLARHRFPELDVESTLIDVTVITDEGAVLRGDQAWIAVLWSVATTRALATRLTRGRGVRRFRCAKGATEVIRRFASAQRDPGEAASPDTAWPPPNVTDARTPLRSERNDVCTSCQTWYR